MGLGVRALQRETDHRCNTISKVVRVNSDGSALLECGHTAEGSLRNPAFENQTRFCVQCTEAKRRV